jgi:hypothetical protein
MDLRESGWGVDWIRLAQDSDRWWAVECGDELSGSCTTELIRYKHGILTLLPIPGFTTGVPRHFSVPRNFVIKLYF